MPLKESPESAEVLAAVPEVNCDRKLVATNNLRARGISGIVEPGPSAPASGIVAEEAATLFPLDVMVSPWRSSTEILPALYHPSVCLLVIGPWVIGRWVIGRLSVIVRPDAPKRR